MADESALENLTLNVVVYFYAGFERRHQSHRS